MAAGQSPFVLVWAVAYAEHQSCLMHSMRRHMQIVALLPIVVLWMCKIGPPHFLAECCKRRQMSE